MVLCCVRLKVVHSMQALHTLLQYNTDAIEFWLCHCLLPGATQQFPQRMTVNAWHLAARSASEKVGSACLHCVDPVQCALYTQHAMSFEPRAADSCQRL